MEYRIIRSAEEFVVWLQERRLWYRDFAPDWHVSHLPFMAVWAETESNGYQTMEYEFFRLNELTSIIESMKETNEQE